MRRLIGVAALLAVLVGQGAAATLRVRATAPTDDNDGTCTAPVLIAQPTGTPRMMHFAWTGKVAGEDSIATTSGVLVTLTRSVPAGSYTVRAWVTDVGGVGCDTMLTVVLKGPPWKPGIQ